MAPLVRKQKLVTVSSVDNTSFSDPHKFISHKISSKTTKVQMSIKAPITAYNLIMSEIYPESKTREQVSTSSCYRLNFVSLCCEENTLAENVLYDFEKEYPFVEYVDFSGYIGSMRLAFDLLKNFKRLKEVVFVVNDYNVNFPYSQYGDNFQGLPQYEAVESVKILHDFAIVEKSNFDVQNGTWRLDEFLQGCHDCFPNLKKFEVSIHGTGANYDKINKFILAHSQLNKQYTVEINNEKVKTKHKQSQSQRHRLTTSTTRKAVQPKASPNYKNSLATSTTTADSNMQIAIIPDLSIVKKEAFTEEEEEKSLTQSSHSNFTGLTHTEEYQRSVTCQSKSHLLFDCLNHDPRILRLPKFTFPADSNIDLPSPSSMRALCWTGDTTSSYGQCMQNDANSHIYQPEALLVKNVMLPFNQDEVYDNGQPQSVASDSTYSDDPHQDHDDEELKSTRFQGARNPSPPTATASQNPVVQQKNHAEGKPTPTNGAVQTHKKQKHPRVPTPPIISKKLPENDEARKLVSYSDGSSTQSSVVSGSSRDNSNDPRLRKRYSRTNSSRSRSVTPPSGKKSKYYPEYSRQSSRDYHKRRGEERNDRSRNSTTPCRERSRSLSPSYHAKLGENRDRDRGRGFKRHSRGSLSGRRPRGRGRGGIRSRTRGRGNRGFKTNCTYSYSNYWSFYNDPRHQEGHNNGSVEASSSQEYMTD